MENIKILINNYSHLLETFFKKLIKDKKNLENIEKAVGIMKEKTIICCGIGKSGYIAEKMSSTLRSLGKKSYFIHPSEASHGDLGMLDENCAVFVISKSGESKELEDIVNFCNKEKITLISLTAAKNNFLSNNSDININFFIKDEICKENLAPTVSTTISLILCDLISIYISYLNGFSKEVFKKYHPGGKLGFYLLKVKDIMRNIEDSPIVEKNTKIFDSLFEISSKGCGLVMIINEGKLKGVLTDGDIRRKVKDRGSLFLEEKIEDHMTTNPKTVFYDDYAKDALNYMIENKINVVPVINEKNEVKGILHIRDLATTFSVEQF